MIPAMTSIPIPIIEVSHVCTRFGKAVVHEDVSLTIGQGEVFAIAGGNGSGKSTLMREIIGLQVPASGMIRLMGMESTGLGQMGAQDVHRRFGVMFQQGALFSSLTLEDNVAVPLK
jgi:phospholipid/cholesterol/gamma-HCH transport system ATP-binding protein